MEVAAKNEAATLRGETVFAELLEQINALFLASNDLLVNSPDGMLIMFLGHAHGAFVGAVRMAASGQLTETFMLLRGAIENGLYATHLARDSAPPRRANIWFERSLGETEGLRVRKEFTTAKVMKSLRETSPELHSAAQQLYSRCIDLGGHPNQPGHVASAVFAPADLNDATDFKVYLFAPNARTLHFLLRSSAEVGTLLLHVFFKVFETRLNLTDFPAKLQNLTAHLKSVCNREAETRSGAG